MTVLGILGGSGVYDMAGLKDAAWRRIASPFGETSDDFLFGVLDGLDVVRPAHGRGHRHSPSSINYRANIDALKRGASPTSCRSRPAGRCARICRPGISW
jgi:Purine nucleoside phosphorylase